MRTIKAMWACAVAWVKDLNTPHQDFRAALERFAVNRAVLRDCRARGIGGSYSPGMSGVGWRPLSWREGYGPATGWREAIPVALEKPLRAWARQAFDGGGGAGWWWIAERVLLRLDLTVPDSDDEDGQRSGHDRAEDFLAYGTPVEVLVDVVDVVLDLLPVPSDSPDFVADPPAGFPPGRPGPPHGRGVRNLTQLRGELVQLLGDALSALRVRADGRGLERWPSAGAEEAFGAAVISAGSAVKAGSAAAHLRAAWEYAHALHPAPGLAYGEAVMAVEAAAHAVLAPDNPKASLGDMRREVSRNRDGYALAIAVPGGMSGAGAVEECLSLLWDGQRWRRHGSMQPTPSVSLEEALMAVHLAVTLVQWFTSGAVRKL
jgi:hypothetical protein